MKTIFTILALFFLMKGNAQTIEGNWYSEGAILKGGDWQIPFFVDEQVPFVMATFDYDSEFDSYYLETTVCGFRKVLVGYVFSGGYMEVFETLEEDNTECTNTQNTQFQEIYFNALSQGNSYSFVVTELDNGARRLILESDSYYLTFTDSLMATEEVSNSTEILLYPNPATDFLHFSEKLKEISIYDLSGKLIKTHQNFTDKLSVNELPKGTYMIKGFSQNKTQFRQKFIKN